MFDDRFTRQPKVPESGMSGLKDKMSIIAISKMNKSGNIRRRRIMMNSFAIDGMHDQLSNVKMIFCKIMVGYINDLRDQWMEMPEA